VKVEIRASADEVTLTIGVRHAFYAELRALARAQGTEPAQLIAHAIGQLVPRSAAIEAGAGTRS
jgi:hypothetical protein